MTGSPTPVNAAPLLYFCRRMRLKQLEIKGFKSFANQTVVNFDADVIGIVGPNGSGKSNIVDSIRWVLGEQKGSELRLDKMASVIFNGTKRKKAGNVAAVSLTFENTKGLLPTEYNMVTITRMLYRSGDSEYRLNGVQCRLKDIRNLFLDTGIGSNSYAIIALGMVDDILADKDNSRRRMFEQAAGISKYKNRKKESLRKLKNTEDDLDRIEDVLHEIDNQLKSLEKQARRARKYRDLKQQYRDLSLLLTGLQLARLRQEYDRVQQEATAAQEAYRTLDATITTLEDRLSFQRQAHADREQALGERQRKLNALTGELRGLENERQLLEQRRQFVSRQTQQLATAISTAAAQTTALTEQLGPLEQQLATVGEELASSNEARETAKSTLEEVRQGHGEAKTALDERLQRQQQEERRAFELEKRRAINGNQIENLRFQIERNEGELDDRRSERASLASALAELADGEQRLRDELSALESQEAERVAALGEAESRRDDYQGKLNQLNRVLDAQRNEHKLTKSLIDSLEGFPESIRFLAKNTKWTDHPRLLSDLLLVEEPYRVAIQGYLEPYLNYYVVDTAAEAAAAIRLLEEQQKGKANFFVLDQVPPTKDRPEAPPPAGGLAAIEVVQVDEELSPLVQRLLHGVYLVERIEAGEPVRTGQTLLAADGRISQGSFRIGGGSLGLFEGKKIGRKKQLELLRKNIGEGEQQASALDEQLRRERDTVQQLRGQRFDRAVQQKQRELSKLQQQRAGQQARLEGFATFFSQTEGRIVQFRQQIADLEASNVQIDDDLRQRARELEQLRQRTEGTDDNFRVLSERLSAASAAYNQENIRYIQLENRLKTLQQELTFRHQRRDELAGQESRNRAELAALTKEARQFDEQEAVLRRNLEVLRSDREEYRATLTSAEQAYAAARGEINQLEDRLRRENRSRQDAQLRTNQLKEKVTDVRFRINAVEERLKIEFNLTLEQLAAVEVEEWTGTVPELELKVDRLRGRIGNYGEVNPMAVEAYDEMKERHSTISQQRDDILDAKGTLVKTIREIEDQATVQFLDAFDRVRAYFIDVFRSLFTEDDNCDLLLLDPENPLESGIEIVAKPKGKRPQTISQLSGGEKTLTATALLFALYLLKPAPFCIFDEVDAPLDDANIAKFNRIVKKFSHDSQFIIVTHNKLTMEAVDSIYGVYTTEHHGSSVLPVRFTELEGSTAFSAV